MVRNMTNNSERHSSTASSGGESWTSQETIKGMFGSRRHTPVKISTDKDGRYVPHFFSGSCVEPCNALAAFLFDVCYCLLASFYCPWVAVWGPKFLFFVPCDVVPARLSWGRRILLRHPGPFSLIVLCCACFWISFPVPCLILMYFICHYSDFESSWPAYLGPTLFVLLAAVHPLQLKR
jgi:hypothetical protein